MRNGNQWGFCAGGIMPDSAEDPICLDDYREHLSIPTLDGNAHVVPVEMIQRVISGQLSLSDCDDSDILIRSILSEWLTDRYDRKSN